MGGVIRRLQRFEPRWRLYLPVLALVLLAVTVGGFAFESRVCYPREEILWAIRQVESGGRLDPPDGDGGAAIGPFQIHRRYWQDAVQHDAGLGGSYTDCRDLSYSIRVVHAYMERWAPEAWRQGHAEVIARTHNGGPTGPSKRETLRYWHRVRARLERWWL